MNERLSEIEKKLERVERALALVTEILSRLVEENTEGKASKSKRWFRRDPILRGKWLDFFAVGFKRPET